jgi:hypothetical protein
MNSLNTIKLLMIIGLLYLFIQCLKKTEHFDSTKYDRKKDAEVSFVDANGVS